MGRFTEMLAVNGFNPTIVLPTHDDVSQPAIRSTLLQGAKVVCRQIVHQLLCLYKLLFRGHGIQGETARKSEQRENQPWHF